MFLITEASLAIGLKRFDLCELVRQTKLGEGHGFMTGKYVSHQRTYINLL